MERTPAAQSYEDLRNAFSDESALALRYLYFAKIAEIEGYDDVAQFCRDVSEGGLCNAQGSLDFLRQLGAQGASDGIGDTGQNLRAALSLEIRGHSAVYPSMAARARSNGLHDVASWFETLTKLKRRHALLLDEKLRTLKPHLELRQDPESGS